MIYNIINAKGKFDCHYNYSYHYRPGLQNNLTRRRKVGGKPVPAVVAAAAVAAAVVAAGSPPPPRGRFAVYADGEVYT